MIKIKAIQGDGIYSPERILSNKEMETVTSVLSNGVEYVYYQGDEPVKNVVDETQFPAPKTDISNIDIDSLTADQIMKLKQRLNLL